MARRNRCPEVRYFPFPWAKSYLVFDSGDVYFWNAITDETQWKVPTKAAIRDVTSSRTSLLPARRQAERFSRSQAQSLPSSSVPLLTQYGPLATQQPAHNSSLEQPQPAQPGPPTKRARGESEEPEFTARLAALRGEVPPPAPANQPPVSF